MFLIIGSRGMLGQAWCRLLRDSGRAFQTADRPEIDLEAMTGLHVIQPSHRVVVHCAGYTDVDAAEAESVRALRINGHAVGALTERCLRTGSLFIHYSSDYVFDGRLHRPWRVDDPIHPINAYGRSKALGEKLVCESGCEHLLIRTSWLYAPWGRNFVRTMSQMMEERDVLRVVDDQRGRPTSAEHLVRCTLALVQRGSRGIYHIADGGECTWFQFAEQIARLRDARCRIEPCQTTEFPRPAVRPAYSVLDLTRTEDELGPMPAWRDNLADVAARMEPTRDLRPI